MLAIANIVTVLGFGLELDARTTPLRTPRGQGQGKLRQVAREQRLSEWQVCGFGHDTKSTGLVLE